MAKRLKKLLKIFLYFHVFVALALLLTHCSFTRYAAASYEQAKKDKPYDVIIVPGLPYEEANTTSVMTMRIYWAKHLYDSGYTKNIIFSGSSVYSPYVEGIAMKIIADSLGIPPDHTFSETKAEHSTENVYYGWKMAKSMGFKKIAVATDPYQAGMLRSFTRKYCPGVGAVPVVFGMLDMDGKVLPVIDVTSAYAPKFVHIAKRESFWQRLRGTMGLRVKKEVAAEKKAQRKSEKVSSN